MTHNLQKGFTLIEMLMVLAIFFILTSITLFNYSKFRSDTILTNMAYEVALSIREAQIYGVSARGTLVGSTPSFDTPYGIYLIKGSNEYYLFADVSGPSLGPDGEFSGDNCIDTGGDACVTPYTMQQNIIVSDISIPTGVSSNCPENNISSASILFRRPNPEPVISAGTGADPSFIQLKIEAPTGSARYVLVYNNGQISVTNTPECN